MLSECNLCRERRFVQRVKQAKDTPIAGEGNLISRTCLIGRNPGRQEILQGRPFIGPAGDKLNKILFAANLPRRECYVTNVVKCFTPSNVIPSLVCCRMCTKTWLMPELISLARLELIITFGNKALHVFEPEATVGDLHGSGFNIKLADGRTVSLFVMYHPSAALRDSRINEHVFADAAKLKTFRTAMTETS